MMPKKNPTKKKKKDILLVLDLNGVLFDRRRQTRNSNKEEKEELSSTYVKLGNFQVYNRPHLDGFIDFLLENFTCAVWSSVQKHNLEMLVDHAWGKERRKKLLFVWGQDKCTSVGFFGDGLKPGVFERDEAANLLDAHQDFTRRRFAV